MKKLVFLIHGIALRSDIKILKYWGKIPDLINSYGFETHTLQVDAFGSITENVRMIKDEIRKKITVGGYGEIHVIGHSKGGVEAYILLNEKEISPFITSVVLLNSPLCGQIFAKNFLLKHPSKHSFFYRFLNFIGKIEGDKNPDSYEALKELSIDHLDIAVSRTVKVFFLQSCLEYSEFNPSWKLSSRISYGKTLTGDGMVEYQSIGFRNFILILPKQLTDKPLTHNSVTGLPRWIAQSKVDYLDLWKSLINITLINNN